MRADRTVCLAVKPAAGWAVGAAEDATLLLVPKVSFQA
jgi:hypothetical protein